MLTAHQTMVAATRREIARGSSPAIVALARKALPVLVKHLTMLRKDAASG
jgi:putative membrane protein